MSELRQDIATKRWVIIASERSKRPLDFVQAISQAAEPAWSPDCPFCPGNEHRASPELVAIRKNGEPDGPGWQLRVVPNKYPALSSDVVLDVRGSDGFTSISGFGYHEIVVLSPRHDLSLATLDARDIEKGLMAILSRLQQLAQDPRVAFVAVFYNQGPRSGSSLAHPHSQIIASPIVPAAIRLEIEEARRFYDDRVRCAYCAMLDNELWSRERVVFETGAFAVLAPYASRVPFELMIVPTRHSASFVEGKDHKRVGELALAISRSMRLLKLGANNPDLNMVLHTAPLRDSCLDYYHWHIEILPRMTTQAGFELGTGIYINSSIPEETAAFLREKLAEHGI